MPPQQRPPPALPAIAVFANNTYIALTMSFQISAPSLAGLVDETTRSLCNYLTHCSEVLPRESRWIEVSAEDSVNLIGNWVDELLLIFQSEGTLFKDSTTHLEERPQGGYRLRSQLWGEPFDPACHLLVHEIPARPIRRPEVRQTAGVWRASLDFAAASQGRNRSAAGDRPAVSSDRVSPDLVGSVETSWADAPS